MCGSFHPRPSAALSVRLKWLLDPGLPEIFRLGSYYPVVGPIPKSRPPGHLPQQQTGMNEVKAIQSLAGTCRYYLPWPINEQAINLRELGDDVEYCGMNQSQKMSFWKVGSLELSHASSFGLPSTTGKCLFHRPDDHLHGLRGLKR